MTGAELKQLLIAEGVSFSALAEKLGVTRQTINSKFKVQRVSVDFLEVVSVAMGYESNYLAEKYDKIKNGGNSSADKMAQLLGVVEMQTKQISQLLQRQNELVTLLENYNYKKK